MRRYVALGGPAVRAAVFWPRPRWPAAAAITLAQSALWWIWWLRQLGPRFLVPLMPFLVLMLGVLVEPRTKNQEPAAVTHQPANTARGSRFLVLDSSSGHAA